MQVDKGLLSESLSIIQDAEDETGKTEFSDISRTRKKKIVPSNAVHSSKTTIKCRLQLRRQLFRIHRNQTNAHHVATDGATVSDQNERFCRLRIKDLGRAFNDDNQAFEDIGYMPPGA